MSDLPKELIPPPGVSQTDWFEAGSIRYVMDYRIVLLKSGNFAIITHTPDCTVLAIASADNLGLTLSALGKPERIRYVPPPAIEDDQLLEDILGELDV